MSAGSEFSRTFVVDPLPHAGVSFDVAAEEVERAALARRFGLPAVERLAAQGWIRRDSATGGIAVEGRLDAAVVQTCVVTLANVPAEIDVEFRRLFKPEVTAAAATEVTVDPLAEEVEPLSGKELDVGEIIAEELVLALDPYPRAPDVDPSAFLPAADDDGPFAALAGRRVV